MASSVYPDDESITDNDEDTQQDDTFDDFSNSSPLIKPDILRTKLGDFTKQLKLQDMRQALKLFLPSDHNINPNYRDGKQTEEDEKKNIQELILYIRRKAVEGKQYKPMNSFIRILAGTQPEMFKKFVKRPPTESEINFCVQRFINELKECIKTKNHCPDSELDHEIDLDCEHVTLSIVSKEADPKKHDEQLPHNYQDEMMNMRSVGSSTITIENILHSPSIKSIIVFGRAGIGKTTTIQWLAREWANERWETRFTLLFILKIRSLTVSDGKITCLELLKDNGLFLVKGEEKELLTASWLKNYADRIIIMIDGLDEVSDFVKRLKNTREITELDVLAGPLELGLNLLKGNLLKGCTLLATSRPFPGLTHQKFDSYLEILGLSPDGIREYVTKHYKDEAPRIISILEDNPVLMSVCGITWYCMQISQILASGFVIDDTEINTYTRLNSLITVKLSSRQRQDCGEFLNECGPYFPQLAELSYNGIFAESELAKVVFAQCDLNKCKIYDEDLVKIRKGGILQVKSEKEKGGRTRHEAEFLHLSVQELLAVTHFLSCTNKSKENLDRIFGGGQFNMACMYMFGVCYDRESAWINDIRCSVNKDAGDNMKAFDQSVVKFLKNRCKSQELDLNLCQLVHEGKNAEHAKIVANAVVPSKCLSIIRTKMTAIDFMALGFVVQYVECLKEITLKEVTADKTSLELMSSSLLEKHRETLVKLDISGNNFGDDGVIVIAKELCATKSQLQSLNLDENNIGREGAKAIGDALSKNKCLKRLNISENPLESFGVQAIAEGLAKNKNLEGLYMSHVAQGSNVGKNIAKALLKNQSLEDLNLNRNNIRCLGATEIGKSLLSHPNLKRLEIANNSIRDPGAKELAVGLKEVNLKLLNTARNKITRDGFKAINSALEGKDVQRF